MQAGLEGPQLVGMHCLRHLPGNLDETAEVGYETLWYLNSMRFASTLVVCGTSQILLRWALYCVSAWSFQI